MGAGRRSGRFRSGGDDAAPAVPRAAGRLCGMPRPQAFLRLGPSANDNRPSGRTLVLSLACSAATVTVALAWLALRP